MLVNKFRSNQSDCSEYFAKEKEEFHNLRQRLDRMISEAKQLHTRTKCLRREFREIEDKSIALRKMLHNNFGFKTKKSIQESKETTYLNRLIGHLKEVDNGLTYQAIHTDDTHECSGI
jgi:predicted nuclease with TOPRIM domain